MLALFRTKSADTLYWASYRLQPIRVHSIVPSAGALRFGRGLYSLVANNDFLVCRPYIEASIIGFVGEFSFVGTVKFMVNEIR